eukprot:5774497-Alexandrium_andersonii.AAC.1
MLGAPMTRPRGARARNPNKLARPSVPDSTGEPMRVGSRLGAAQTALAMSSMGEFRIKVESCGVSA